MQPSKHVLPLLVLASEALLKEQRCSEICSEPKAGVLPFDSCIAVVRDCWDGS